MRKTIFIKNFEKIDKNSDGLLSKEEMIEAHRNRIDKQIS